MGKRAYVMFPSCLSETEYGSVAHATPKNVEVARARAATNLIALFGDNYNFFKRDVCVEISCRIRMK